MKPLRPAPSSTNRIYVVSAYRNGQWADEFFARVMAGKDSLSDSYHCRHKRLPEGAAVRKAIASMAEQRCAIHVEDAFQNKLQTYYSLLDDKT